MSALVERKPEVVLVVEIPGVPVGKARARTVRLKNGRSHTFTPKATVTFENWVRERALSAMAKLPRDRFPLDEPVGTRFTFRMRKPKNPRFDAPATRPDVDNLIKAVKDGLKLAGVYVDDCRIVQSAERKIYGEPGVLVEVLRWR